VGQLTNHTEKEKETMHPQPQTVVQPLISAITDALMALVMAGPESDKLSPAMQQSIREQIELGLNQQEPARIVELTSKISVIAENQDRRLALVKDSDDGDLSVEAKQADEELLRANNELISELFDLLIKLTVPKATTASRALAAMMKATNQKPVKDYTFDRLAVICSHLMAKAELTQEDHVRLDQLSEALAPVVAEFENGAENVVIPDNIWTEIEPLRKEFARIIKTITKDLVPDTSDKVD